MPNRVDLHANNTNIQKKNPKRIGRKEHTLQGRRGEGEEEEEVEEEEKERERR